MKRYITYYIVLLAMLFVNCTSTTEGLDSAEALIVSTKNIEMACNGGKANFEINSYCTWTLSSTEDWSWITPSTKTGNKGNTSVKLTLAENTSVDVRAATITIENGTYGLSHKIAVQQEAGAAYIKLSKKSVDASSSRTETKFTVESNVDYTISSDQSWCKIDKTQGSNGKETVTITIEKSGNTSKRTAKIKVVNNNFGVSQELTVNQAAFGPSLVVSNASLATTCAEDTKQVTVESNISWAAACEADWVTFTPANGTEGTKTITINIARNATTSVRTAKVKISNKEYNVTKEITINQEAFGPSLDVSNVSLLAPTEGETEKVTVNSNIPWAATCEADWVTISPANGSEGTKTLTITIDANATTTLRSTKVLVSNTEYGLTKEITIGQAAFGPSLAVSSTAISATSAASTKQVTIESNISWAATCDANWVTISPANGSEGTKTLTINITKNTTTAARAAKVLVSNSEYNITKEITINQVAFAPSLTVSSSSISATSAASTKQVTVESNISWAATCNADWVTISPANGTEGTKTLTVTVATNATTAARTAKVLVSNSEYNLTKEITINQVAFAPSLTVSSTSISATSAADTKQVTVESNISWAATCDADWVTISPANGTEGTKTLTVTIAKNATTSARTAKVVVSNSEYSITKEIAISQAAFVPALTVSNASVIVTCATETKQVTIESNVSWAATCEADWVTLSPLNDTEGTKTLDITIAANKATSARNAKILVSNSEYSLSKEIAVTQPAFEPVISIGNTSIPVDFTGGTHFIPITANVDYEVSTNVDWITIENTTGGVNIKYLSNPTDNSRSGDVVVTNEELHLSKVVKIIQAPSPSTNVIRYTTTNGEVILPYNGNAFGANIVSITNENGSGVIKLDAPATTIGANAFKNCSSLTSITIPEGVKTIGESAFEGCTSLTGVTIPNGVTSIGSRVFYGCSALTTTTIPSSVTSIGTYAFYNCSKLTTAAIPSSVTSIASYTFYGCSSLTSVTIPSSVTSIETYAFYGCSALSGTITIPTSVKTIGTYTFYNCSALTKIVIPKSVTSIEGYAFSGCTGELEIDSPTLVETNYTSSSYPAYNSSGWLYGNKFTKVTLGSNVTKIGNYTFYGCSYLTSVTIPSSVKSIGNYAFRACSALTSVTIPTSVTSIGTYTFYGCSSLETVAIPNSVTSIGTYAFYGCSALTKIVVPKSVTSIGGSAFSGCTGELEINNPTLVGTDYTSSNYPMYSSSYWLYGSKFTKLTIGSNVTTVGDYVFYGCTSLKTITIPESVTTIGTYAFYNCTSLSKVVLPKNISYIGGSAFSGCTGELEINSNSLVGSSYTSSSYPMYNSSGWLYGSKFTKLTLGSNVTKIGNYAFRACSSLTSVTIPTSVTSIGSYAFYGCSALTSATVSNKVTSIGTYAFYNCAAWAGTVTIPEGVTSISSYTFYGCSSLTKIVVPKSVTSIGSYAFYNCAGELSINSPTLVGTDYTSSNYPTSSSSYWLYGNKFTKLTLGSDVTTVGDYVFYGCTSLKTITIPESVTTIGTYAFYNCTSLSKVVLPKNISYIGGSAFSGCAGELEIDSPTLVGTDYTSSSYPMYSSSGWLYGSKFTKLTLGSNVTKIGNYLFYGCSSLTGVTIPASLTSVGSYAFENCTSLSRVDISNLSAWCKIDFSTSASNPVYYGKRLYLNGSEIQRLTIPNDITMLDSYAFYSCNSLTEVVIPSNVTYINNSAFSQCQNLASVTIGSGVKTIWHHAFSYCPALESLNIPDNVETLGNNVFKYDTGLKSVVIGRGTTSIGDTVFNQCTSLTSVYCAATTPATIGSTPFANNASNRKIYVPVGRKAAYQSAWSSYSSYIEEVELTPTLCTSLSITADNVDWDDTTTTIHYTAVVNGTTMFGDVTGVTVTGTATSSSFAQNTSTTSTVQRTVSFTYYGETATCTITQGMKPNRSYTVNLNSQWRKSTSVSNPNSSTYDGVYESNSNYNVNSGTATMYIDINGYTEFSIYVRSNAESNYDYVMVSQLDKTITGSSSYSDTTLVKAHTRGNQQSGTTISNYTKVTYSNISSGTHRITIVYRKDTSQHSGTDRGYVLIPKNQ